MDFERVSESLATPSLAREAAEKEEPSTVG